MLKTMTLFVAAAAAIAGSAMAQEPVIAQQAEEAKPMKTLTIGDKAPPINEITWIKGKGIDAFKPGDSYVVECWATWCGPCIQGIPHLTKLQKQYKDKIKIMGIAIWEQGNDIQAKVTKFVEDQGDQMDYTVGMEKNNSIARNWMTPAGQNGIPCAYLVDKTGHIAWIGHPGSIDPVLESYTAGTWDVDLFAVEFRKQQEEAKFMDQLGNQLQQAMAQNDPDKAIELLDSAIAKKPDMMQLKYSKFMIMLSTDDHARKAYETGEQLLVDSWDNAQMLNSLSWSILTDPPIKYRDLDFALKAAERANNLTDGQDPSVLDTLARAWFDKGDFKRAIEVQEKAVSLAPEGQMKDELKQTLEKYVAAQPKVG